MMMPFDASSTATQQSAQGAGLGPQQPLPRPPMGHMGSSIPGAVPTQGHPAQHHHQQGLNAPFPHAQRQHSNGMGGPGFAMPPQSPSPRGSSLGMPPSGVHGGPSPSFQHHSLHSPHMQQRQPSHHSQHVMQHSQQPLHSSMHHSGQRSHGHRPHPQASNPNMGGASDRGYIATGLNGNWQSDNDMQHRREMIQHIVKLLKQRDKNPTSEWLSKLPQMAKQLEVSLYRSAQSFEAYSDMSTLKKRLQVIAYEVSQKAKNQGSQHRSQNGMRNGHPQDMMRQNFDSSSYGNPQMQSSNMVAQDQRQQMMDHRQLAMQRQRQRSNNLPDRNRVVHTDEINPMMQSHSNVMSSVNDMSSSHNRMSPGTNGLMGSMNSSSRRSNDRAPSEGRSDSDWKNKIRHKQQRLLLLHHSAKCSHEDGRCPVTPHCADMKRLWKHMHSCTDNECKVSHCFSSRSILSHYRKCREPKCPSCGPVRETVRRSPSSGSSTRRQGTSGSSGMDGVSNSVGMASSQNRSSSSPKHSQHSISTSVNNSVHGQNSYLNNSGSFSDIQRQSSQTAMPPPVSASNGPNMAYGMSSSSTPFHSNSNDGAIAGVNSGQLYRNDQKNLSTDVSLSSGGLGLNDVPSIGSRSSGGQKRNDEWQKVKHKQQRLLLLRHASKCKAVGTCPSTPHCAAMKRLWDHISACKDQHCKVQHCMSSRYVLSHYRRCKDSKCPACGPVREKIRNSERDKPKKPSGIDNSESAMDPMMRPSLIDQVELTASSPSIDQFNRMPPAKKPKMEAEAVVSAIKEKPNGIAESHRPLELVSSSAEGVAPQKITSFNANATKTPEKTPSATTKPVEDLSLINSFTVEEIETHINSLNRTTILAAPKLKTCCSEVLRGLQSHQHGWVFNTPVDPVELGLPDYFDIIKRPMDLGTIQRKLEAGAYHALEDFHRDVNLTFDNAMTYNEEGTVVHDMANELKEKFTIDYRKLLSQLQNEETERRKNDRACVLCGCERLLFEPAVFFCNGMNCSSKRIRRNSFYYYAGNNQYFWCLSCYNELDEKTAIELVDLTIKKSELTRKKNDEVHEENWVQCDSCERWIHQICGLFNTRKHKAHESEYCCPNCLLARRKSGNGMSLPKPPGASDLPRTKLSIWLERHVRQKMEERKMELANEKATAEHLSLENALKAVNAGGSVTIRQVTSTDRKLEVREKMKNRYAHKNYPDEFPFRCKCILVFQKLDGVDVVLFALYVYEHGENNPAPNKRTVYISYLDSVHFMRPRPMRTFIYHEILISYLDYARQKGFSTAHIWACPPLKGDDYIFYAKPEAQKTPKDSRLRQWYFDMLKECQRREIVGTVTNMYDLYFNDPNLDATAVPYLEGDYFPGEAENIIKDLEEGRGKKSGSSGKKKNKKKSVGGSSKKSKSSGSDDEEDKPDVERDPVMVKLGEIIQPMKESFIVAFLAWEGAKPDHLVVPPEIQEHRAKARLEQGDSREGTKRSLDGSLRLSTSFGQSISELDSLKDPNGRPIKIVDDDLEELDCEFFNNRQAFLDLCRGNHYQFDELRRAKHTSMMVLWHLHNRDAPKFVQQCASCSREIVSGTRYHCSTCADFDLCEDCYKNPRANRGSCTHKLEAIAVETSSEGNNTNGNITPEQRKERQRNLELHIQLIEHASRCDSKNCKMSNCAKMKAYLKHGATCTTKASGGCKICKRIWALLRIHANKCKSSRCPIPQCIAIRERVRQLQKQQQAMDDRRRQEMNRHYRMGMVEGR